MRVQLFINELEIDLYDGQVINFPITYSIADIKNPEKRKRSSSKTIKVPGTQNNRLHFKAAWDLHIADVDEEQIGFDFDPTFRYLTRAIRDGKNFFRGSAWLQKTVVLNDIPEFHVSLFSEIANLMQRLGDVTVAELGWSEYDHVLSVANIQASWIAPTGSAYVYPLIDYGYTEDTLSYLTNELLPYVYELEILEKCIAFAEFNLVSTFLNTVKQKKVIWGSSGGELVGIDAAAVAERRAHYTADGFQDHGPLSYTSISLVSEDPPEFQANYLYTLFTPFLEGGVMNFTLIDDDLGQFNTATGELTIAETGTYNLALSGTLAIEYFRSSVVGTVNWDLLFRLQIYKNGAWIQWQEIDVNDVADNTDNLVFNLAQQIDANAGDIIEVSLQITTYKTSTTVVNEISVTWDWNDTFDMDLTALDAALVDGDTVSIARFLPVMKASDFVQDMIVKYNLYTGDPDEDGNILMEPIDDFYFDTDDVDQWSEKRDKSKPMEIMAAQNVEGKTYEFRYAQDRDYYKLKYFETFGIDYGDRDYNVPSTFKKGSKIYMLKQATTCPVQIEGTDIIIPRIVKFDESTEVTSPHKGKPRAFFYNGLIASDDWELVNAATGAATTLSSYPQAHHLDSLTAPTKDLLWGPPREVFYIATAYILNNLFQEGYSRFIRELTGRDSKVITAFFKLNETDFYENFMRRLCNVDGVLYRKNIVHDFLATKKQMTKVELVRIVEGNSIADYQIAAPGIPSLPIDNISLPVDHNDSPVPTKSSKSFYPVDTSGGDVVLSLDGSTIRKGKRQTFKKTEQAGKMIITPVPPALIDGQTSLSFKPRYTSITIRFDGDRNFYIE